MVDLCGELHLWRLEGILRRELNVEKKDTALVRRVTLWRMSTGWSERMGMVAAVVSRTGPMTVASQWNKSQLNFFTGPALQLGIPSFPISPHSLIMRWREPSCCSVARALSATSSSSLLMSMRSRAMRTLQLVPSSSSPSASTARTRAARRKVSDIAQRARQCGIRTQRRARQGT